MQTRLGFRCVAIGNSLPRADPGVGEAAGLSNSMREEEEDLNPSQSAQTGFGARACEVRWFPAIAAMILGSNQSLLNFGRR